MWAAALSRSGKRCTRVSRGRCPGRTRLREPPQPPGLASSPRLACLACPCICAGCCSDGCGRIDRSGRVLHHTSPSRTAVASIPVAQGVPLALGRRQVERLPHTRRVLGCGWLCGAHRACAAAATTKHLHAYACEGADENSWQSRPRHTRASNKVLWSASRLHRCRRSRPSQNACNSSLQI